VSLLPPQLTQVQSLTITRDGRLWALSPCLTLMEIAPVTLTTVVHTLTVGATTTMLARDAGDNLWIASDVSYGQYATAPAFKADAISTVAYVQNSTEFDQLSTTVQSIGSPSGDQNPFPMAVGTWIFTHDATAALASKWTTIAWNATAAPGSLVVKYGLSATAPANPATLLPKLTPTTSGAPITGTGRFMTVRLPPNPGPRAPCV
jgi:hypothetical protein